jgi:uncharacterized protein
MVFIDTGFLIALFEKSDSLHRRAAAWARHLRGIPLLISEFVLLEAYNHFSKRPDRAKVPAIRQAVQTNPQYIVIKLSPQLFARGVADHERRPDMNWSVTDCISFHVMQTHNVSQAPAYDHHLEQAGFEALLRRDP